MAELSIYAEAFCYPAPGKLESWIARFNALPEGARRAEYAAFLQALQALTLGEWEELYTRTLDLSPEIVPYLGYQIWGDSYKRGSFMAQLNKAMQANDIHRAGELPDHLVPVLRYLDEVAEPLPELTQVLGPGLEKIASALKKQDPANPYLHLLKAVITTCVPD